MALGRILRENREQQGYSPAQVAEATHMMVQIVEELEREDFQRIAAPIYGRGFVKLYAEFLGIDPAPLVKEFSEIFSGSRRPVIATRPVNPAPSSDTRGEGAGVRVQGEDLSSREADNPDNPVILSKKHRARPRPRRREGGNREWTRMDANEGGAKASSPSRSDGAGVSQTSIATAPAGWLE